MILYSWVMLIDKNDSYLPLLELLLPPDLPTQEASRAEVYSTFILLFALEAICHKIHRLPDNLMPLMYLSLPRIYTETFMHQCKASFTSGLGSWCIQYPGKFTPFTMHGLLPVHCWFFIDCINSSSSARYCLLKWVISWWRHSLGQFPNGITLSEANSQSSFWHVWWVVIVSWHFMLLLTLGVECHNVTWSNGNRCLLKPLTVG